MHIMKEPNSITQQRIPIKWCSKYLRLISLTRTLHQWSSPNDHVATCQRAWPTALAEASHYPAGHHSNHRRRPTVSWIEQCAEESVLHSTKAWSPTLYSNRHREQQMPITDELCTKITHYNKYIRKYIHLPYHKNECTRFLYQSLFDVTKSNNNNNNNHRRLAVDLVSEIGRRISSVTARRHQGDHVPVPTAFCSSPGGKCSLLSSNFCQLRNVIAVAVLHFAYQYFISLGI